MGKKKLTTKRKKFVREYLIDLNGKQAAIRAGYSERTADRQASRLLSFVEVKEAVVKAMEKRSLRTEIDAEWVLVELAKLYKTSIADFLIRKEGEHPTINLTKATPEQLAALDEVQIESTGRGKDEVATKVKIKLSQRLKTLAEIGRHVDVQAFKDKVDLSVKSTDKMSREDLTKIAKGK